MEDGRGIVAAGCAVDFAVRTFDRGTADRDLVGSIAGRDIDREASLLDVVDVVVSTETADADRECPNLLGAFNKGTTALRWRTWPLSAADLVVTFLTCWLWLDWLDGFRLKGLGIREEVWLPFVDSSVKAVDDAASGLSLVGLAFRGD